MTKYKHHLHSYIAVLTFAILLPPLRGQCQTGETCQSLRGCQELAGILLEAKQTGDELRKQEIVQFLRSRVCSKEDRAVCCASQGQRQSGEIEGDIQKFIACN